MKKLTSLGCLLALVFAGASAFADSWFNGFVPSPISLDNTTGTWTVPSDSTKWSLVDSVYKLNDWDQGAVFAANTAKSLDIADSKVTTTVKFTAMDPEDLDSYSITDAKAGVTLVELADNSYQFKVIQNVSGENVWVDAGDPVAGTVLDAALNVTVEIFKSGTDAKVKYTIGTIVVDESVIGVASDMSIRAVEYKGQCEITPALTGLAWGNVPEAPSSVVVTEPPQGYVGPTTIKYDHGDLKARLGANADDDAAVLHYFTTKQGNGQFGWVNYALGQEDNENVGIQSNEVAVVNNELSFDFGFVVDEANYEVTYTVDDGSAAESAKVEIESGVHEVVVTVKEKGEQETYDVTNQVVGVMQAESPASEGKKAGTKVYEIVAVPWEAFGHTAVTVENLLVTSLLTAGDTLYVWNDAGYYDTYVLTAGKWVAQSQTFYSSQTGATQLNSVSPAENALEQGTAVWLEHDAASKLVFTGMLKDDSPSSTVRTTVSGSETEDVWTLVANPSVKPFALSGIEGAAEGDRIVIEDAAEPREYEFKRIEGNCVWGYDKKVVTGTRTIRGQTVTLYGTEWTVADPIPAGIGFWYVRKAGGSDLTITFGDNDVEAE